MGASMRARTSAKPACCGAADLAWSNMLDAALLTLESVEVMKAGYPPATAVPSKSIRQAPEPG